MLTNCLLSDLYIEGQRNTRDPDSRDRTGDASEPVVTIGFPAELKRSPGRASVSLSPTFFIAKTQQQRFKLIKYLLLIGPIASGRHGHRNPDRHSAFQYAGGREILIAFANRDLALKPDHAPDKLRRRSRVQPELVDNFDFFAHAVQKQRLAPNLSPHYCRVQVVRGRTASGFDMMDECVSASRPVCSIVNRFLGERRRACGLPRTTWLMGKRAIRAGVVALSENASLWSTQVREAETHSSIMSNPLAVRPRTTCTRQ